jgi:signal transduction histidine kinase
MTFLGLGLTVAAAYTDQLYLLTVLSGASLTFLPITTGIAVSRYRLYDLDRVISRTVTYAVVSAFLVALWTLGVIAVAAAISANVDSALPASIATLAAAAAGVPVLRGVRDVVDKRFRRRRYDALSTVRTWVGRPAGEAASEGVEQVLRAALRHDALQVAFWLEDQQRYVDSAGYLVEPLEPRTVLTRAGSRIACVTGVPDSPLLHEVCTVALPELEAAQLRAALQTRITELSASRERLSTIAQEERRRLERDLHDGAQQRLLSVLFNLESAQRREGSSSQLTEAIDQTRVALAELRDLAHGLRPTALHDDGLIEAVDALVTRCPVPTSLTVHGPMPALPEEVESAAYYVVSEALTNATKHAAASTISVQVHPGELLVVTIRDDGLGGADPDGHGLRGLADRAEVAGGLLRVISDEYGTEVRVELPCGS